MNTNIVNQAKRLEKIMWKISNIEGVNNFEWKMDSSGYDLIFKWFDYQVELLISDPCVVVDIDGEWITNIYWSSKDGMLHHTNNLTSLQRSLVNKIMKIVLSLSNRRYKLKMDHDIKFDNYQIHSDGFSIVATEKVREGYRDHEILYKSIFGELVCNDDYEFAEIIQFIKKNFIQVI